MTKVLNLGEGLNKVIEERNYLIGAIKSNVDNILDSGNTNVVMMLTTSPIGGTIIGLNSKYEAYNHYHKTSSLDTLSTNDLDILYNLIISSFYQIVDKEVMFEHYSTLWHFNDDANWNDVDLFDDKVLLSCGYKASSLFKDIICPLQEDVLSILSKYSIHFNWIDLFNKDESFTLRYPIEITTDKVILHLCGNCKDEDLVKFALHCNKRFPNVYKGESDYSENDYGNHYPNSLTLFFTDEAKAILSEVSEKHKDVFPIKGMFCS